MSFKKRNQLLMIFGVIFIAAGLILASTGCTNSHESVIPEETEKIKPKTDEQKIEQAIDLTVMDHLKADGYMIEVIQNSVGYDVNITLSNEENFLQYKEWCGLFGTDLIYTVKLNLPEVDKKIVNYNFSFMANYKITYTAVYVNNSDDVDHVKLALIDGDTVLSAKTYQEYSKEKDALILSLKSNGSDTPLN